jgi:signal peptidase II
MVDRRKLFFLVTFIVLIIDQITKYLTITFNPNYTLGFISIHLIKNTGAGFGILQGQTIILGIISLVVALAIIFSYKKLPTEKNPQILYALFLGGVIGNLIDRFFRRFVIDFIDFSFWPAFNIADAAITVSVIGLIIYYWIEDKKNNHSTQL